MWQIISKSNMRYLAYASGAVPKCRNLLDVRSLGFKLICLTIISYRLRFFRNFSSTFNLSRDIIHYCIWDHFSWHLCKNADCNNPRSSRQIIDNAKCSYWIVFDIGYILNRHGWMGKFSISIDWTFLLSINTDVEYPGIRYYNGRSEVC